jgi:hypothetical protein
LEREKSGRKRGSGGERNRGMNRGRNDSLHPYNNDLYRERDTLRERVKKRESETLRDKREAKRLGEGESENSRTRAYMHQQTQIRGTKNASTMHARRTEWERKCIHTYVCVCLCVFVCVCVCVCADRVQAGAHLRLLLRLGGVGRRLQGHKPPLFYIHIIYKYYICILYI